VGFSSSWITVAAQLSHCLHDLCGIHPEKKTTLFPNSNRFWQQVLSSCSAAPPKKKKNNVTLAGVVKPMESLWNLEKAKKG
jgi:hypothetical protein